MQELKKRLDAEVEKRNVLCEVSLEKPDPILVAHEYQEEFSSLVCALFAYGNAHLIVRFLKSLDFSLLDSSEENIQNALAKHYYRFQKSEDVIAFFISLRRLKQECSLEELFMQGYVKNEDVMQGLNSILFKLQEINTYTSRGYQFLIGKPCLKENASSAYKRWHMFLRWMVRKDCIDFGLWKKVHTKDLIIPLDTHTFHVSHNLGLLKRKTYDLKAAKELTNNLKNFDANDPVKYDFALYRIGQEKLI